MTSYVQALKRYGLRLLESKEDDSKDDILHQVLSQSNIKKNIDGGHSGPRYISLPAGM